MREHPRLRYYPHSRDYLGRTAEFRPFIMYTNEPNVRSKALNTDQFGMRFQYDANGEQLDWRTLRGKYDRCNVLIGNSTVFGVDVSGDRQTINHGLNEPDCPCVNLSIRGATSQQEVMLFLTMKHFLPRIENIVLFSGVINISVAAIKQTAFYPEIGSIFSEKEHFSFLYNNYERFSIRKLDRMLALLKYKICRFYTKYSRFRRLADWMYGETAEAAGRLPDRSFSDLKLLMTEYLKNDLRTWSEFGRGLDCRTHFVLQPVLYWTTKTLTEREKHMCHEEFRK